MHRWHRATITRKKNRWNCLYIGYFFLFFFLPLLQQLLLFLSSISKGSTQDRLRWTFRLYDMDGDGVIQLSELFTLIWAIHEMAGTQDNNKTFFHSTKKRATNKDECVEERDQEKRRVKLQAEKIFQRWDLNKDGLVSWEEFLTCCLRDENIASSFNYFLC